MKEGIKEVIFFYFVLIGAMQFPSFYGDGDILADMHHMMKE